MLTVGQGIAKTCRGVTRRDFLKVGGLSALGGLASAGAASALEGSAPNDRALILLMLVGGPSQLETWDPKPTAPADIRGPFGSIPTAVPGVRISEYLPLMAQRLDRLTLIRSMHHNEAPIHETGHQLIQTGGLWRGDSEPPHVGSVVARCRGAAGEMPPFVAVPGPIRNTGVGVPHGQSAGSLGRAFDPFYVAADPGSEYWDGMAVLDRARSFLDEALEGPTPLAAATDRLLTRSARQAFDLDAESGWTRDAYGRNTFGQSCLLARRLVEAGVHVVTVNMFETVFHRVTWDCHGSRPFSTLDDYSRELLPMLDRAYSALIDDLERRRLLDSTMVVATGEFGRTPRLNAAGGRDHWPGVWSAVVAGGGASRGQVVGASDDQGAAPADRPVTPAELVASMYQGLHIDADRLTALSDGKATLPAAASPIRELFA
jgi:hypothetical protein